MHYLDYFFSFLSIIIVITIPITRRKIGDKWSMFSDLESILMKRKPSLEEKRKIYCIYNFNI